MRTSGAPFSPRAYAYLAVCCAVLLTSRQQVLLSALVEQVRHAAPEAGLELGRRHAGRPAGLRRRAAPARRAGACSSRTTAPSPRFADNADAEALLFVRRDLVRHLLAVPLREVESPDELVQLAAEPASAAAPATACAACWSRSRPLLVDDVDDESWAWLRQSQRREATIVRGGLRPASWRSAPRAWPPSTRATSSPTCVFPRGGTLGHAALLDRRRARPPAAPGDASRRRRRRVGAGAGPACSTTSSMSCSPATARGGATTTSSIPSGSRADVEELLVAMGLLRRRDGRLRLAAIANRYAPDRRADQRRPTLD